MSDIDTYNAEFKALKEVNLQHTRLGACPVVDDDFPEVKLDYDNAVNDFLKACKKNGRKM